MPERASPGWFGGSQQPPPQQVVYQQAPPQKSGGGIGMGTVALAGTSNFTMPRRLKLTRHVVAGGGLVGGMLLENAIDDHDDRIAEQAYDNGT